MESSQRSWRIGASLVGKGSLMRATLDSLGHRVVCWDWVIRLGSFGLYGNMKQIIMHYTDMHGCIHAYLHTYIHACMHILWHTYMMSYFLNFGLIPQEKCTVATLQLGQDVPIGSSCLECQLYVAMPLLAQCTVWVRLCTSSLWSDLAKGIKFSQAVSLA